MSLHKPTKLIIPGVEHSPPVDILDKEFPLRLTTGRVLDSYNTGVQTEKYSSPIRTGETLDISKSDAKLLGIVSGEHVQVTSRRGTIKMTINKLNTILMKLLL